MAILETREERVKLLRAGVTGREIERWYIYLHRLEIVGVNWCTAAAGMG